MSNYFRTMNYLPKFIIGFILGALLFGTSAYAVGAANTPATGYVMCVGLKTTAVFYPAKLKCPVSTKMLVLGAQGKTGATGPAGAAGGDNTAAVRAAISKIDPAVYSISCGDQKGAAWGVDVIVSAQAKAKGFQGSLITQYSLVKDCVGKTMTVSQGGVDMGGALWSWDEKIDLALLHTLKPVKTLVAASVKPVKGDQVIAIGNAINGKNSVSTGVVSNLDSSGLYTNAPMGIGYRGAPLIDMRGELVGTVATLDIGSARAILPKSLCVSIISCPASSYFLAWQA